MNGKNTLSRITIDIPKVDHKRLKTMAAILGKSMREVVTELIQEKLKKTPNKKTLAAIKKVEKGKDLKKAKNATDLFKKLGI